MEAEITESRDLKSVTVNWLVLYFELSVVYQRPKFSAENESFQLSATKIKG
jgi:hypothetical protein